MATFVNELQSETNQRYDSAQILAAKILFKLNLYRNDKLVEWLSRTDSPNKVQNIGRLLEKQRRK